jgi:hypothetical protein
VIAPLVVAARTAVRFTRRLAKPAVFSRRRLGWPAASAAIISAGTEFVTPALTLRLFRGTELVAGKGNVPTVLASAGTTRTMFAEFGTMRTARAAVESRRSILVAPLGRRPLAVMSVESTLVEFMSARARTARAMRTRTV